MSLKACKNQAACRAAFSKQSTDPDWLQSMQMEKELLDLDARLVSLASRSGKTLCSCESFTAGLFSAGVASVSGASAVLKGGLVVYWASVKEQLAHVDMQIIKRYGVVSSQCAAEMAAKTRTLLDTDYCVSFTGNAGPQAQEGKPVGLVYCALADRTHTECFEWKLDLPRNLLRLKAASLMAEKLIQKLEKNLSGS